jgi:uncharacterized protein YktB (UPF0637 family)
MVGIKIIDVKEVNEELVEELLEDADHENTDNPCTEMPEEAVKGLLSAFEDVKKGDYIKVIDDDADHESKDDNNVKEDVE